MTKRWLEYMPLDQVQRAPRNPKRHATHLINAGIAKFGLGELPLLDERTGRLVAGHGRLDDIAARHAAGEDPPDGVEVDPTSGQWLVPVVRGWSSRSDPEAAAYLVLSNRVTEVGGWDYTELATLMQDDIADPDLQALTAWDPDEIADIIKAAQPPDLDQLAYEVGEPDEADTWPTVRIRCAPHVAAAWRSHLDTHGDDTNAALAALLDVDPAVPDTPTWTP